MITHDQRREGIKGAAHVLARHEEPPVARGGARRERKAGRPGYGFGPLDLATTVAGAAAVEVLQGLARKLAKRRRPAVH